MYRMTPRKGIGGLATVANSTETWKADNFASYFREVYLTVYIGIDGSQAEMIFSAGTSPLAYHEDTAIRGHVKERSGESPYDGDGLYWGEHLGHDPTKPQRDE